LETNVSFDGYSQQLVRVAYSFSTSLPLMTVQKYEVDIISDLRIIWFLSRVKSYIDHGANGHWHKLPSREDELLVCFCYY